MFIIPCSGAIFKWKGTDKFPAAAWILSVALVVFVKLGSPKQTPKKGTDKFPAAAWILSVAVVVFFKLGSPKRTPKGGAGEDDVEAGGGEDVEDTGKREQPPTQERVSWLVRAGKAVAGRGARKQTRIRASGRKPPGQARISTA